MTREEAIFALEYYKLHFADRVAVEAFDMAIKALEQEPKTGWIPVSERLPENGKEVLIYLDRFPYLATYEDGAWETDNFTVDSENEPVAWLPLPEPYKEG